MAETLPVYPVRRNRNFQIPIFSMARPRKSPSDERPDWAARIVQRRTDLGVTQKSAAELLGISQSTYGDYETGRSEPSLAMFRNIANLLDTKPSWLVFGIGDREGEVVEDHAIAPALDRRFENPKFKQLALKIREVLTEHTFFHDDQEFLIVLTSSSLTHIEAVYYDTPEAFEWAIQHIARGLDDFIKEGLAEMRLALLSDPKITYQKLPKSWMGVRESAKTG